MWNLEQKEIIKVLESHGQIYHSLFLVTQASFYSVIAIKHLLRLRPFPLNRRPLSLRPQFDPAAIILNAMHEPLTRARLGRGVVDQARVLAEVKPPQQLRRRDEKVAFRQMDAGTDATAGPVAEMVALVWFFGGRVDGGESGETVVALGDEALGDEALGACPSIFVVVECPDVEDDGRVFGEMHSIHVVI